MTCHFILYVQDQRASTEFYAAVLERAPDLNVPGMTEFRLGRHAVLGLMPVSGIKRLLGDSLPDPTAGTGGGRAEIYLRVADASKHHVLALANGARELSPLQARDWGDLAAYSLDMDGHVLAFAEMQVGFETICADGVQ